MDQEAFRNLSRHGAPKHSKIIMTPSAYMNDEAWLETTAVMVKGIHAMLVTNFGCLLLAIFFLSVFAWPMFFLIQVICDHPDWWCVLSLDGFTSHLNVVEAQNTFAEHTIFVIKEEVDTSAANQPYNQAVA